MAIRGWIYIITNSSMPGLVKIGYSTNDPVLRAAELGTGSPHPYNVEYDVLVEDPQAIEQKVHRSLANHREGKEWFRCGIGEAIDKIRKEVGKGVIIEKLSDQGKSILACDTAYTPHPHDDSNRAYSITRIKDELEQIAKERKREEDK